MLLNLIKNKYPHYSCVGVNTLIAKINITVLSFFHFIIFKGYNKISLGLQKQMQEDTIVPKKLWCTSYRKYNRSPGDLFLGLKGLAIAQSLSVYPPTADEITTAQKE